MLTYLPILIVVAFNFVFGFLFGFTLNRMRSKLKIEHDEKTTYCHGFEDGIYYAIDEYNPELFRPEIAEMCYKEYKAIKHGPERH